MEIGYPAVLTGRPFGFDIMIKAKDKEASALKAVEIARTDERFYGSPKHRPGR